MREIVKTAAFEIFGRDLSGEQDKAVEQLLKGVKRSGGSASRSSYEQLVRTAFEGGVVACLTAMREKQLAPFLADCHKAVDRVLEKERP